MQRYSAQQYLRSAEEMEALFSDLPSAIENTVEISKRCTVKLDLGNNYLPNFPIPDGSLLKLIYLIYHKQDWKSG